MLTYPAANRVSFLNYFSGLGSGVAGGVAAGAAAAAALAGEKPPQAMAGSGGGAVPMDVDEA